MLTIIGLDAVGEHEFAEEVRQRFCKLCEHSAFAENFDAISGEPLRDKGYTWTASVYLLLRAQS